ncbi:MAG: hypothetical protein LKE37_04420 [Atopobiaceae bacterium]|nr:hypothetical protein [Atopobiaceae bacterium]
MTGMVEDFDIPSVDRGEVLRYLGHAGQDIPPDLDARIDDAVARCMEVARPRGVTRVFDVDLPSSSPGRVALAGAALTLDGRDISAHLGGATAAGLLAVTLGIGIDRELRLLSATDPLAQVVLDAAATALVERAADAAEALLVGEAASRGLFANDRYSCGYGDFPLDEQRSFVSTLDAGRLLGLGLTPSNLLVPTKSVTAVLGMFGEPQPGMPALCPKCHCHDFCTIRATGRTCRG